MRLFSTVIIRHFLFEISFPLFPFLYFVLYVTLIVATMTCPKSFSFLYSNAQSLDSAKANFLSVCLSHPALISPSVLFLSEARVSSDNINDYPGLQSAFQVDHLQLSSIIPLPHSNFPCTRLHSSNSGVVVCFRDYVNYKRLPQFSYHSSENITQIETYEISAPSFHRLITVFFCYIHPSASNDDWLHIRSLVAAASSEHRDLLLLGDLNARHRTWFDSVSNKNGTELLAISTSHSLENLNAILAPGVVTHPNPVHDSIIDLALCSSHTSNLFSSLCSLPLAKFSDHIPMLLTLLPPSSIHNAPAPSLTSRIRWNLDRADWSLYRLWLDELLPPWLSRFTPALTLSNRSSPIRNSDLIDAANKELVEIITSAAKNSIPHYCLASPPTSSSPSSKSPKWYSLPEVKLAHAQFRRAFSLYSNHRDPVSRENFRQARNL